MGDQTCALKHILSLKGGTTGGCWCLLFRLTHLHAMKQPLGKMLWKIHCSLMQVGDWWDWEIDIQRTTGLLSVLLELEKCREFCHCFLNATRFIWDHSEGRVQWSMAGIVTEMLGCFPRAAPSVTAAHRTDSSSGRREQGTAADLGNRTGITFTYCK